MSRETLQSAKAVCKNVNLFENENKKNFFYYLM